LNQINQFNSGSKAHRIQKQKEKTDRQQTEKNKERNNMENEQQHKQQNLMTQL